MKILKSILILSGIAVIGACTTTPEACDPSRVNASVFDKAGCKFSGSYDKRIEEKEKILLDEKATNAKFNRIYADIQQQQRATSKTLAQKKAEQQKLNKSVAELTGELKAKAKGKASIEKEIAQIEKQMKQVNNSGGSEMEKQVELERLQQRLVTLQRALGL